MERKGYALRFSRAASEGDIWFGKMVLLCMAFLLWATIYGTGCGNTVEGRASECMTSSDCGGNWVCQCPGNSIKGGQCVEPKSSTGIMGDCNNISAADMQETDLVADTGVVGDISEVTDIGSDTVDSADVAADIWWQDVADMQVESDFDADDAASDVADMQVESDSDVDDAASDVADVHEGSDVDDVGSEVWADAAIVDAVDATDFSDAVIKEDVGSVSPDVSIEPDAPDTVVSPPDGMIYIPGGTFWMGCNEALDELCWSNEKPQHEVTLSDYFIDTTEVTVAAYEVCVSAGVCLEPLVPYCNYGSPGKGDHPVNCVTWCQARDYCLWKQKRLPTEAEWEMAARGSCEQNKNPEEPGKPCKKTMRTYPWGEDMATCEFAVMDEGNWGCGKGGTWVVGSKPDGNSPYGVKDMSGNVWEWVEDCYGAYSGNPVVNPPVASCVAPDEGCQGGHLRILRGGSFYYVEPRFLRASCRQHDGSDSAYGTVGFRCARSIP